jgi:hypothetical protein
MTRYSPKSEKRITAITSALLAVILWTVAATSLAEERPRPLVLHVKTALSVDDAQICVVPNVAWAALAGGRAVTIVFDGSAVTSVARRYGWRGWLGIDSTAMDRAALPERERKALAKQFDVSLETVPHNYGQYLHFVKDRGAKLYYNTTMAMLYKIPPARIDSALSPLDLKALLAVLTTDSDYLVY